MKQFLFTHLSEGYKINAIVKKADNQGFLGGLIKIVKYFVMIEENNKFLFSVTKEGFNTYLFSMNKDNTSENNKNYLGKMVSQNLSNSNFILYDNGFDPK